MGGSTKKSWNSWKIEKELGSGAFGKVYQVSKTDEFGNKYTAALKVIKIPKDQAEHNSLINTGLSEKSATAYYDTVAEDIIKEAVLLSRLKGAGNIVGYEDNQYIKNKDGVGGTIYIRMELLTPLLEYIKHHRMDRETVIKLGIDICKALEACHSYDIIHRDIKPENIFVSNFGDFKLGDFGIARTMRASSSEMSKKGTYTYMAPEVYKGDAYNKTVDIYSLGLVLYRYLNNGKVPFLPEDSDSITYRSLETARQKRLMGETIPKPSMARDDLGDVILKACAYDPEARYRTPKEFRQELEKFSSEKRKEAILDYEPTDSAFSDLNKDKTDSSDLYDRPLEKKKSRLGLIIAGIIGAIVIAVLVIALVFIKPGSGSNQDKKEESSGSKETDISGSDDIDNDTWLRAVNNSYDAETTLETFEGHAYAVFNYIDLNLESFDQCEQYCEDHGGHLAVIDSQEENDFLYNMLTSKGYILAFFGYTDEDEEGVWRWVDGSSNGYTNWCQDPDHTQPNNKGGHENYAQFYSETTDGSWNDAAFGKGTHRFICEWEPED